MDAGVYASHIALTSGDESLMGRVLGDEMIVNGGFEDFPNAGQVGYFRYNAIPGWTPSGEATQMRILTGDYATGNTPGNAVMELDVFRDSQDAISQTFTATTAGTYQTSYDYGVRDIDIADEPWWYDAGSNSFRVEIDGQVVQVTGSGVDADFLYGFQHRSFDVELSAGEHTIRFLEYGVNAYLTDNGGGAILDNVSVRKVDMAYDKGVLSGVFFYDGDADGRQSGGEAGIGGRTVHLLDGSGAAVTDANGAYAFSALAPGDYQVAFDTGRPGDAPVLSAVVSVDAGYETVAVDGAMTGTTIDRVIEVCENETAVADFDTTCNILSEDVYFIMTSNEVCATVARTADQGSSTVWNNSTTTAVAHYVFLDAPAEADLTFTIHITTDPDKVTVANPAYLAPDGFAYLTDQPNEIDAPRYEEIQVTVRAGQTQSEAFYVGTESTYTNFTFGIEITDIYNAELDASCPPLEIVSSTPIALDLNRDGQIGVTGATTSADKSGLYAGDTVLFDMDGDGVKDRMEWFDGSGDGILIDNRDGRAGIEMNGLRLFGDDGGVYADGYDKLRTLFDANGDGVISGAELTGLALWVDDGDAVVEAGEIQTLAANSVTEISGVVALETDADGRTLIRSSATQDLEATGHVDYLLEGADAALFQVDADGVVTFISAPDYETPLDADGDNIYEVTLVRVTDDPTCAPARENLSIEVCDKPSLGDTVWYDDNHDGLLDNGEHGAAGVTVELLDAVSGAVLAQTVTNANGNYLFDDIDPGDYVVRFTAPDGYQFTSRTNIDPEAANGDSDVASVSGAQGSTGVIHLDTGERQLNIDAGLRLPNHGPAALDDSAKACADDATTVDVLANDTDADGDPLTITAVNGQAIAEGQSITAADGVSITLTGGKLVFDASATAYAEALVGSSNSASYSYTISDGDGGVDTAAIDMTYYGGVNTLATIEASLPASGVMNVSLDESGSYFFDASFEGTGDTRLDGKSFAAAFCDNAFLNINTDQDVPVTFEVYDGGPVAAPIDNPENMDLVAWVLNQGFAAMDNGDGTGRTYTDGEIQGAIWGLLNSFIFVDENNPAYGTFANAQEIYDLAVANGEGYLPGEGDVVAVIVDPTDAAMTDGNEQPFVIGVAWNDIAQDCMIFA